MSMAGATYVFGSQQQPVQLPELLRGQVHLLGIDLGSYRLFLIAVVIVVTLALTWLIERTRFGAAIRASVDNQQAAAGLGINVYRVFSLTFALGSGLAGLGGGLGIDVLGLDPTFPLKYMFRCDFRTAASAAPQRNRRGIDAERRAEQPSQCCATGDPPRSQRRRAEAIRAVDFRR